MTAVTSCPICNHGSFKPFLECKDHTVSKEIFTLIQCSKCGLVITSPVPKPTQIGKYYQSENYISHSNKASTIIDKIYLIARRYTLQWKLNILSRFTEGKTILDFGCGTGDFINTCKMEGWSIHGIEPSNDARLKAQILTGSTNIHKSIEEVDNKFEAITLWHVLEHIPDLNQTLASLKLLLHNNGTMFIAVPNRNSWDSAHYKEHWAGYDVPRHLWHFSRHNIETLMSNNGLKVYTTLPMRLDAYYISLMSEKYKKGGKLRIPSLPIAVYNGARSNKKARKTGEYSSLIYIVKNDP